MSWLGEVLQTVRREITLRFAVDSIENSTVVLLDLFVRQGKDTTRQTGFRVAQNGVGEHEVYDVILLRGS